MRVTTEPGGSATIVMIHGDSLDAGNVADFKREMTPLIGDSAKLVMDLSALQFVDSSGLGGILSCLRQISSQGRALVLCSMTKPVRTLFELVRMHRIFDIVNTREEALRLVL
jgi:anti-sigma B factor antagonist